MGRRGVLALLASWLVTPRLSAAQTLADEVSRDDQVRQALAKEGDNGLVPRHVDHWAYPLAGGTPRAEVMAALKAQGYEVEPSAGRGGVKCGHVISVAGTEFDALTLRLEQFFAARGWEYDGWETVVVRKGSS